MNEHLLEVQVVSNYNPELTHCFFFKYETQLDKDRAITSFDNMLNNDNREMQLKVFTYYQYL